MPHVPFQILRATIPRGDRVAMIYNIVSRRWSKLEYDASSKQHRTIVGDALNHVRDGLARLEAEHP
jgi:hypothetical protein